MSDPFENPYGPDPIELTPQAQAFYAKYLRPTTTGKPDGAGVVITSTTPALPEPSWIKQAYLERPQPTTEGEECVKVFERYAARHMGRRRSFLARLADSVRGQK